MVQRLVRAEGLTKARSSEANLAKPLNLDVI